MTPMQREAIKIAREALIHQMLELTTALDEGKTRDGKRIHEAAVIRDLDDKTSAMIELDELLGIHTEL